MFECVVRRFATGTLSKLKGADRFEMYVQVPAAGKEGALTGTREEVPLLLARRCTDARTMTSYFKLFTLSNTTHAGHKGRDDHAAHVATVRKNAGGTAWCCVLTPPADHNGGPAYEACALLFRRDLVGLAPRRMWVGTPVNPFAFDTNAGSCD